MAVIYLRSTDGSDASDGLTWANAKATLAAALTAAGAGGTVYVSDNHAETQASAMSLASPGTAASPVTVLCANDAGDPEPPTALATTATVSTTAANNMSFTGFTYFYGITFSAGSGGNNADIRIDSSSAWWMKFEACTLKVGGTIASSFIRIGGGPGGSSDDQLLELINTILQFGHADQGVLVRCTTVWKNTASALAGTMQTSLFQGSGNASSSLHLYVNGVDLSAMGSGKAIVLPNAATFGECAFENCKLGASVTLVSAAPPGQGGVTVEFVNCDSADTNYRYYKRAYQGEIFHESTIVRTGGASDGTTAISRKMTTSANSKLYSPLVSSPIAYWNDTTGSAKTVTVEVVTDNVTLTDAEAWIEIEYLGTSGFPLSSFVDDAAADILATPANQTSSSVAWTTTGLTTPVKQKLSATFTPQEKGPVYIRVMLAKASTTMYFCPKADVS